MEIPAILQTLNRSAVNPKLSQIKNLMQTVRSAGNPNAMMQQMLSNNPQYAKAMNLIRQNGGDARAAFYKLAEQSGVDPEEILSMLK